MAGPPSISDNREVPLSTPNCLTFVKTTAIAYGQKIDQSLRFLVVCNSSRFYKRQTIGSSAPPTPFVR